MKQERPQKAWIRRRSFFGKFVVSFVTLIVFVVAVSGALEAWFAYRDTTEQLAKSQGANAKAAAGRIEQFISEIERQISWATRASSTTLEQRRTDYALLLEQVPAIDRLIYLDSEGKEQLRLVRDQPPIAGEADYSGDPRFKERETSRSGCRRSISTGPIRLWRSRWCIPAAMPAPPSLKSTSSSFRLSSTEAGSARMSRRSWSARGAD